MIPLGPCIQAQEEAELAQLQKAKRKALEQRDAQMRQLDDLKARILAERCPSTIFPHHSAMSLGVLQAPFFVQWSGMTAKSNMHQANWQEGTLLIFCD